MQYEEHLPKRKEPFVMAQPRKMLTRQRQSQRVSSPSLFRHEASGIMLIHIFFFFISVQNEKRKEADVTAQAKKLLTRQYQRQRVSAYALIRHKMRKVVVLPFVLLKTMSGFLFSIFGVCNCIEPINNIILSDFFAFFFTCTTLMISLFIP